MKPIRIFFMLTALLAFTNAANAQSMSAASLQALRTTHELQTWGPAFRSLGAYQPWAVGMQFCPPISGRIELTPEAQARVATPTTCEPCWFTQALQQCVASYQRMRGTCSSDSQRCAQAQPVCGMCPLTLQAAGCVAAAACPVQTRVTATAPCCCAKACACCESCKAAKGAAAVRVVPATPFVQMQPFTMPVPPPVMMQVVHVARPAKFVTPDLEGHCEQMTHKGDTVVLEGNVLLLCKKHAQPMRIEAQRVIVNMKDGSFTVQGASQMSTTSFGVMRTSIVDPSTSRGNVLIEGHLFRTETPQMNECFSGSYQIHSTPVTPTRQWIPVPNASDRVIRVMPVPPMVPSSAPSTSPGWIQR